MATTIKAGYDLFATDGEAFFSLPMGLGIPQDFFDKGSQPWTGLMTFIGLPFRTFRDPRTGTEHKTGEADTVVERKKDVTINQIGGSGTTPIELVGLQLKSRGPIAVRVGDRVQHWDVQVGVSSSRPSAGNMTITLTGADGGNFDSDFMIVPKFRFIRQADGEEKVLDFGAMRVPDARQALVARISTLQAYEVPFQTASPADRLQIAGLTTSNFAVPAIGHHTHSVVAVHLLQ
jgi:hypothetical protein